MATVTTAWKDAQRACYKYLCTETGYQDGVDAFIGDRLPNNKANLFCFIVSGGRTQTQNYQVPTPAYKWLANAVLRGQFLKLDDAMDFASLVQQQMPVYKDKDNAGQIPGGHVANRGIPPNVEVFEATVHPDIFSDVVELEEGKKIVQYWIVVMNFRFVYNNQQV